MLSRGAGIVPPPFLFVGAKVGVQSLYRWSEPARVAAVALSCGVAAILSSSALAQSGPAVVECQIRAKTDASYLRLEAVARSELAISGRYAMTVVKQSASGTSNNYQSGAFHLAPRLETILTIIGLDRSAEGHYTAELKLEWNQGSVSCSSP